MRIFFLFLLSAAISAVTLGQAPLTPPQAEALVARALATESRDAQEFQTAHPMRYRLRKSSPRLTTTKEVAETKDGDVARLIAINDQTLSADGEKNEQARLDALIADPNLQEHRRQSENNDTERALKVLRVLPTAFIYQYAGRLPAASGTNSLPVEKFTFKPNPQFAPPDIETGVLTAMAGEIWIDPAQERVVRLAGSLQQDKELALGLVALDKGGWVEIEQADVGAHQWRIVHLKLKMNTRVLFKTKNSDTDQTYSQFSPLPVNLGYQDAIKMLRSGTAK